LKVFVEKNRNQRNWKLVVSLVIAAVTFFLYLPALQNDFVNWDDGSYVYENVFIRSLDTKLLRTAFFEFHVSNWHPLTWLSHALDYSIWGLDPLGHHLTNNILHAINALVVVFVVVGLMGSSKKSETLGRPAESFKNDRSILITGAATGLLFGIHPLHVESVAWVSERKDLLCAFFFLLCVMSYLAYATHKTYKIYLLSLTCLILALLSKPMAVTLPVVLLILDYYPLERIQSLRTLKTSLVEKLPFIALSLASSIVTILAQKSGGAIAPAEALPLSSRAIVAVRSLIRYLWKMIVPLNLAPYYPYPENVSLLSLKSLFPIVFVIGFTVAFVMLARRNKLFISVWGYYVITLLPVLGIIQVGGQSMADRYSYLPSLGPFLIAGLATARIYEKISWAKHGRTILQIIGGFAAIAVLFALSHATRRQIALWQNSLVLWSYVVEKEPGRIPLAHNNFGVALRDSGQINEAIDQYQIASRLKPDDWEPHNNLGNGYLSKGNWEMAIHHYQMASRLRPDDPTIHNNLGAAYLYKGMTEEAIKEYETALRLKPDYPDAYFNLGSVYLNKGLINKAREAFASGLKYRPDDNRALQMLSYIKMKSQE